MKNILAVLAFTFFSLSVHAKSLPDKITCTARIALNRTLKAELDRTTRELKVMSDNGATWEGIASKYISASTSRESYNVSFLNWPQNQPSNMALNLSPDGDFSLCLTPSECFLCR